MLDRKGIGADQAAREFDDLCSNGGLAMLDGRAKPDEGYILSL